MKSIGLRPRRFESCRNRTRREGILPFMLLFLLWTRMVATRRMKGLLQVRAKVVQGTEAICIREERKNRGWAEQDRGCGWGIGRRKRSTNAALCTFMSGDKLHQWIPNSKMYSLLATGSPHPALLSFPCVYFCLGEVLCVPALRLVRPSTFLTSAAFFFETALTGLLLVPVSRPGCHASSSESRPSPAYASPHPNIDSARA